MARRTSGRNCRLSLNCTARSSPSLCTETIPVPPFHEPGRGWGVLGEWHGQAERAERVWAPANQCRPMAPGRPASASRSGTRDDEHDDILAARHSPPPTLIWLRDIRASSLLSSASAHPECRTLDLVRVSRDQPDQPPGILRLERGAHRHAQPSARWVENFKRIEAGAEARGPHDRYAVSCG